jgi:hypothetical protein
MERALWQDDSLTPTTWLLFANQIDAVIWHPFAMGGAHHCAGEIRNISHGEAMPSINRPNTAVACGSRPAIDLIFAGWSGGRA